MNLPFDLPLLDLPLQTMGLRQGHLTYTLTRMQRFVSVRIGQLALNCLAFAAIVSTVLLSWTPIASALPQGNAVTDGREILRISLPFEQKQLREADRSISEVERDINRSRRFTTAHKNLQKGARVLERRQFVILESVPEAARAKAEADLETLKASIETLDTTLLEDGEREVASEQIETVLTNLETFEMDFVEGMPFTVPAEYDGLPRLLGRADVELTTTAGTMVLTLDGYNAPISAGNFADLVSRGFYDGLGFDRVEDFYVIQLGDPEGPEDGFIDPATGQKRTLPLEIRAIGEELPLYGESFYEAGLWEAEPVLPFSARGTLALARYDGDYNSASSQFFIFLAEPELTPAGLNLLDGNFSTFGYVTRGLETLYDITLEDQVIGAKLISGEENLVR